MYTHVGGVESLDNELGTSQWDCEIKKNDKPLGFLSFNPDYVNSKAYLRLTQSLPSLLIWVYPEQFLLVLFFSLSLNNFLISDYMQTNRTYNVKLEVVTLKEEVVRF